MYSDGLQSKFIHSVILKVFYTMKAMHFHKIEKKLHQNIIINLEKIRK